MSKACIPKEKVKGFVCMYIGHTMELMDLSLTWKCSSSTEACTEILYKALNSTHFVLNSQCNVLQNRDLIHFVFVILIFKNSFQIFGLCWNLMLFLSTASSIMLCNMRLVLEVGLR